MRDVHVEHRRGLSERGSFERIRISNKNQLERAFLKNLLFLELQIKMVKKGE